MGADGRDTTRKRLCDDDEAGNMFDSSAEATSVLTSVRHSTRALKALNTGLRKQASEMGQSLGKAAWDDEDGYYIATIHETMDDRYVVTDHACGRGVFSSIVKAKDKDLAPVAIKVIRANEAFAKPAKREIEILEALQAADGHGKHFIVQMLSTFQYRGHVCIVFECMWDDCREALRKLTKGKGMTLLVVRAYAQQLLLGLRHMEKCKILHLDIKPDNILISEDQTTVKYCDFGTAAEVGEAETTGYIMSRSYRAPEIILGVMPDCSADTFSLACALYELFTGKMLFNGRSNHDQLRKIMDVKGNVPAESIKAGVLWKKHFDDKFVFKADLEADLRHSPADDVENPLKLKIQKLKAQMETFPKQQLQDLVFERVGHERCKSSKPEDQKYVQLASHFAALLEDMLCVVPQKRMRPKEALTHVFFT